MTKQKLGCCYYPEHWPQDRWADDARAMVDLGLSVVRIGEFAWSRLEPHPGKFHWDWLDCAIDTLGRAGLEIILGTPTACPPKWLVDAHPDILAHDDQGRVRRFGSRRHYCFSSERYLKEAVRIADKLAQRYGEHEAITGWQLDNEYGCHDTVRSFSPNALAAFRRWLRVKYKDIGTLNTAWGTVFWSQELTDFDQVDLPMRTVTEANPSQLLDFYRFSSDQVIAFNRAVAERLRAKSPGRFLCHNIMGDFTDFDPFALGQDLDCLGWDSYPLGFLDQGDDSDDHKAAYRRQGDPDFAAFHHDLTRAASQGPPMVLEQQPGPVNWATNNAAPLPGMVSAWTAEALAHGCSLVSYFRWRQAPFGQEMMHAGLQRPDGKPAPAWAEVAASARSLSEFTPAPQAPVALLIDYEAGWQFDTQPHGQAVDYWVWVRDCYRALRRAGLSVDIVSRSNDLDGYRLLIIPSLPIIRPDLLTRLRGFAGQILIGPRTGSRTDNHHISPELPPGPLQDLIPLKVVGSESLPPGTNLPIADGEGAITAWRDMVETALAPLLRLQTGEGVAWLYGRVTYLAGWPDPILLKQLIAELASQADLASFHLPAGVRLRQTARGLAVINYARQDQSLSALSDQLPEDAPTTLPPGGFYRPQ